jgi:hypothetical protein
MHKLFSRQLYSDKDELAGSLFVRAPYRPKVGAHELMDALKNYPSVGAIDVQNAFVSQHVRPVAVYDGTQQFAQLALIERAIRAERKAHNIVIMMMSMHGVIAVRTVGTAVVSMVTSRVFQKRGINVQCGVEIEAVQVEYFRNRYFTEMYCLLGCPKVHAS